MTPKNTTRKVIRHVAAWMQGLASISFKCSCSVLVPNKAQLGPLSQFPLPVGTFGNLATSICALACSLLAPTYSGTGTRTSVTTRVPGCDKGYTMDAYSFSFPSLQCRRRYL